MTIFQYLQNPYGKGAAFGIDKSRMFVLAKELEKLEERITYKIYRYRGSVIYHVVIPSGSREDVTYDVIIEVDTKRIHEGDVSTENVDFKVFSNCPSFIFTYANVFKRYHMTCDWLLDKYSEEVQKGNPQTRNRYGVVGLERSLFLAMRFLHLKGLTRISTYENIGIKTTSRDEIIKNVRTQEEIMEKVKERVRTREPIPEEESTTAPKKNPENPQPSLPKKKARSSNATAVGQVTKSTRTNGHTKKTKRGKSTKKI